MFNPNNFVYFVFKRPYNASYGFTSYSDLDGNLCMIVNKKDKDGNPIPRRFRFSLKDRTMRIPINQKDINQNSVVEFLRNHPECKDSPNGSYRTDKKTGKVIQENVWFGELNDEKDAGIAIEAKNERLEAENFAIGLKGEELSDVGALLGFIGKSEAVTKHKVVEYAGNSPKEFLEIVGRKDVKAKALITKGLNYNILTKKGNVISWEDTTLGTDIEKATKSVLDDKKLMEALEDAVQRYK